MLDQTLAKIRFRFGQSSSVQQVWISAYCIDYNNGPYLLVYYITTVQGNGVSVGGEGE